MKPIKLSPIKRMMMFVLSLLVHSVYHVDVFGWTVVNAYNTTCSALTVCRSHSSPGGYAISLSSAPSAGIDMPGLYSQYSSPCLCLNSAEYRSLQSCSGAQCSTTLGSNYTGVRAARLNSGGFGLTCNAGYSRCSCRPGLYANGINCLSCLSGYYCTGVGLQYLSLGVGLSGTTAGLSPCPGSGTSNLGATTAYSCFLPTGSTGTDTKGAWKYRANCYYAS